MAEVLAPLAPPPMDDDEADEIDPLEEPFFESEARWSFRLPPGVEMNEDQFFQFCVINRDLRMERHANGDIVIKTPEGMYSGPAHVNLVCQFGEWSERDGTGRVCARDAGFTLPNKAVYGPDLAWILKSRLRTPSKKEWDEFAHLCPDFVLELRARSERLPALKTKMQT